MSCEHKKVVIVPVVTGTTEDTLKMDADLGTRYCSDCQIELPYDADKQDGVEVFMGIPANAVREDNYVRYDKV